MRKENLREWWAYNIEDIHTGTETERERYRSQSRSCDGELHTQWKPYREGRNWETLCDTYKLNL